MRGKKRIEWNKYQAMWTVALFDLPVKGSSDRREYTRFRRALLGLGFDMLQFSVYARFNPTKEGNEALLQKIQKLLPPKGEVRLLSVTDRQFSKMRIFLGKKREETEKPPEQLLLF